MIKAAIGLMPVGLLQNNLSHTQIQSVSRFVAQQLWRNVPGLAINPGCPAASGTTIVVGRSCPSPTHWIHSAPIGNACGTRARTIAIPGDLISDPGAADLSRQQKNLAAVSEPYGVGATALICLYKPVLCDTQAGSRRCAKTDLFLLSGPFSEGTVNHRFLCLRGHSIGESPVWHPCVFLGQISRLQRLERMSSIATKPRSCMRSILPAGSPAVTATRTHM
ncbi:hypothetical protein [Mesorhizobium sp. NPDC059025]|uniref:hypothetical protein n=1 Tax=unclassified Mesorhizobium TaxID=325217 RepID=UPI0036D1110C